MSEINRAAPGEGQKPVAYFTGKLYAFDVYRCMTCGLIQLYDRTDL